MNMHVDLTISWTNAAEIMIAALKDGTPEGQRLAADEVRRMAGLLDTVAQQQQQQEEADEAPMLDMTTAWAECEAMTDRERMAYISGVPEGYDTVLGFLARHNPWALAFDLWDPEATQRDGFWCKHRAAERGLRVTKVQAPPILNERGIYEVNAYPVELLRERLA